VQLLALLKKIQTTPQNWVCPWLARWYAPTRCPKPGVCFSGAKGIEAWSLGTPSPHLLSRLDVSKDQYPYLICIMGDLRWGLRATAESGIGPFFINIPPQYILSLNRPGDQSAADHQHDRVYHNCHKNHAAGSQANLQSTTPQPK